MQDQQIIALYWQRSELAIVQTAASQTKRAWKPGPFR